VVAALAAIYGLSLLHQWWPSLYEGLLAHWIAVVLPAAVLFLITPFRRAAWDAITVIAKGPQR